MVLNNTKSSSKFDNCLIRSIKMRYLQHLSVFSLKTIAFLIIIFSTTFESNAFDDRLLRLVGWLPPLTMFHSVSFRLLLFFFSPTTRIHVYHKRVHIFSLSHFYQNWDLISENGCGPRIHASPSQYKHPNSAQRLRSDSWYIKKIEVKINEKHVPACSFSLCRVHSQHDDIALFHHQSCFITPINAIEGFFFEHPNILLIVLLSIERHVEIMKKKKETHQHQNIMAEEK